MGRLQSYKHRFFPWLAVTVRSGKNLIIEDKLISKENIIKQLIAVFTALHEKRDVNTENEVFKNATGFGIDLKPSTIENAGKGVFITEGGVHKGQVVALYPGSVYSPTDYIFFPSINNSFVFRCSDYFHVDGCNTGLSKYIFKSNAYRDRIGMLDSCDMTWLTGTMQCPFNVGQFVNNQNKTNAANVLYQELDIPNNFPVELRKYIPNVNINSLYSVGFIRVIALVAKRDINKNEELFSTYFTVSNE